VALIFVVEARQTGAHTRTEGSKAEGKRLLGSYNLLTYLPLFVPTYLRNRSGCLIETEERFRRNCQEKALSELPDERAPQ
jgi:hypothetical protein